MWSAHRRMILQRSRCRLAAMHWRQKSSTPVASNESTRELWETLLQTGKVQGRRDWIGHFETLGNSTLHGASSPPIGPILTSPSSATSILTPITEAPLHHHHQPPSSEFASSSALPLILEENEEDDDNDLPISPPVATSAPPVAATEQKQEGNPSEYSNSDTVSHPTTSRGMQTDEISQRPTFFEWNAAPNASIDSLFDNDPASNSPEARQKAERVAALEFQIEQCVLRGKPADAYEVYQQLVEEGLQADMSAIVVRDLYFQLFLYPKWAMEVLRHYQQLTEEDYRGNMSAYSDMYRQMCESVQFFNSNKLGQHFPQKYQVALVTALVKDVQALDHAGKELCLPVLISSLAAQRVGRFDKIISRLYEILMNGDYEVSPGYFQHILSFSRYQRSDMLPFDDVLRRCVEAGRRPAAASVVNALQNMFPYHGIETRNMLDSLAALLKTSPNPAEEYPIDIAVLEAISAAAAQKGNYETNFLVWNVLSLASMEPTIGLYENTVAALCARPATYKQAFLVLEEMQSKGHAVPRALIRGISAMMRTSATNVEIATDTLREIAEEGQEISLASLNVLMSTCAERGDIQRTDILMEEIFPAFRKEPDNESFSYALEALSKQASRKVRFGVSHELGNDLLVRADALIAKMESGGKLPCQHVVRAYTELLCQSGEVESATSIVRQFMDGGESHLISSKIVHCVAVANAKEGNMTVADELVRGIPSTSSVTRSVLRRLQRQKGARGPTWQTIAAPSE